MPCAASLTEQAGQLVASHGPVLLDEDCDGLAVFTHVSRPDEQLRGFGEPEIMLVVRGVNGYISRAVMRPERWHGTRDRGRGRRTRTAEES